MATFTSTVYVNVIEDVINKVRNEFLNNGPGEDVLKELQGMWEAKMMQAGVVSDPIERSVGQKPTPGAPITPVHDLNVPYEGTEEFETPTAEMLFPPTPLQTPIQTPFPGTGDNLYNIPTGPNDHPTPGNDAGGGGSGGVGNSEVKNGRPSPYMLMWKGGMRWTEELLINPQNRTSFCLERESLMNLLHNIILMVLYPSKMELGMQFLRLLRLR